MEYSPVGRLVSIGILAISASCTVLTNLDGYAGEPSSLPRVDAAYEDSLASVDATVDGGESADASADAGADSNARFCSRIQPPPTFCEDFDRPPLGGGWSSQLAGEVTIMTENDSAVSPPSSRRVTVAATPASGPCRYAFDQRPLGEIYASSVKVEHDLMLGHLDDTGGFPPSASLDGLTVSGADGSGACDVYYRLGPGSASLIIESETDRAQSRNFPLSVSVKPRTWTHLAVEIKSPTGAPPVVSVWVDGSVALAEAPIAPSLLCKYGRLASVALGVFCYGDPNEMQLRVDNLVVSAK